MKQSMDLRQKAKGFGRIILLLTGLLVTFIIFNTCKSVRIPAPPEVAQIPVLTLKTSYISVPILIDVMDLETKINREMTGLLYEDNSLEDNNNDNLMYKAWKLNNFSFSINGNELSYRLPLKLWIKTGFKIDKFGITVSDYREFNGAIVLNYKTQININPDFTLTTKTTSNGFEWIETPTIKIAGRDISVKFVADIILKAGNKMINKEIDEAITKYIDLRKYMQEVWTMVQKPVEVNKEYNLWLKINPSEIYSTPIIGNNNKINFGIALKSVNEIIMSQETPAYSVNSKLPQLGFKNSLDPYFSLFVNTAITFSKANELLQKEISGKEFSFGKRKIKIEKINIYGSNDKFVVALTSSGSFKGEFFLSGKPVYNDENKSIEIKELDFDINTKNTLIKTADWLLHGGLIKIIAPKLKYSLADRFVETKKQIEEYLDGSKSISGITFKGELDNMTIDDIYISTQAINVVINVDGKLSILINKLSSYK